MFIAVAISTSCVAKPSGDSDSTTAAAGTGQGSRRVQEAAASSSYTDRMQLKL